MTCFYTGIEQGSFGLETRPTAEPFATFGPFDPSGPLVAGTLTVEALTVEALTAETLGSFGSFEGTFATFGRHGPGPGPGPGLDSWAFGPGS